MCGDNIVSSEKKSIDVWLMVICHIKGNLFGVWNVVNNKYYSYTHGVPDDVHCKYEPSTKYNFIN